MHPASGCINGVALQILEISKKQRDNTPRVSATLAWIRKNIEDGMEGCLLKGKLLRDDLEILEDRQANWMEFCVLFCSIAQKLGFACSFGIYRQTDGASPECNTYHIFATENGKTAAISPYASTIAAAEGELIKNIGTEEFLRRVEIFHEVELMQVLHTTPALYYLQADAALWLHRPEPNVLSIIYVKNHRRMWDLRYVIERQPAERGLVRCCTLIDFCNRHILTTSQSDSRKFSKLPGFGLSTFKKTAEVLVGSKRIIPVSLSAVLFGKNTKKILELFAEDVKKHYNPMYA